MVKALLYYIKQKVLKNGFLVYRKVIPTKGTPLEGAKKMEVDILEMTGEKALVLLPKMMSYEGQNTALVDLIYLE